MNKSIGYCQRYSVLVYNAFIINYISIQFVGGIKMYFWFITFLKKIFSDHCFVIAVPISAYKQCSVRLYLQLFVEWLMTSCLIYIICVCLRIVGFNTYCVVLCCSSSYVPYIDSFS